MNTDNNSLEQQQSDDRALRELFADFQPRQTSSAQFMQRLDIKLDAVEMIRTRLDAQRQRSRRALAFSGLCGVVTGILLSICFPTIANMVTAMLDTFKYTAELPVATILTWVLIAATTAGIATAAYNLADVLIASRRKAE
ncbi:MAG: hypothetical protein ACI4AM_01845 [Muribaculaceae bacterium]